MESDTYVRFFGILVRDLLVDLVRCWNLDSAVLCICLSDRGLSRLAVFESFVAHRPAWRAMADHLLLIFARK
jgi:hypothetical protein